MVRIESEQLNAFMDTKLDTQLDTQLDAQYERRHDTLWLSRSQNL